MLTLAAHTRAAGVDFSEEQHRKALTATLPKAHIIKIHRAARLAGYAYLWPKENGLWFVGGFAIHPDFRFGRVIAELLQSILELAKVERISSLESHVYKTNTRSLALHNRLGFEIVRENEVGVAFSLNLIENAS